MTAEQVFRAVVIKQVEGYSCRTLAFHLEIYYIIMIIIECPIDP